MWVKLVLFICGLTSVSARVNFYRRDYTYAEEFDAHYKFHWDHSGSDWYSSFIACNEEEAELFYPRVPNEFTVGKKLAEAAQAPLNVTDIFVGVHDMFSLGQFVTVDGHLTSDLNLNVEKKTAFGGETLCVTMNLDTGALATSACVAESRKPRPFLCRKVEDVGCPTIDKGYKYVKGTKKCYKKNANPKNWRDAMDTCFNEGGTLVIVTNEIESREINGIIDSEYYFAGFRKIFPFKYYYTTTGHKIENEGFINWIDNNQELECGSIRDGDKYVYFSSNNCEQQLPFVCEMYVSL